MIVTTTISPLRQMKIAQKKQIRYLPVLRAFFLSRPSRLHQTSTLRFIVDCLRASESRYSNRKSRHWERKSRHSRSDSENRGNSRKKGCWFFFQNSNPYTASICCIWVWWGFGRSMITKQLGIKEAAVSRLITKLLQADIIEPVSGYGKGKYRFKSNWDCCTDKKNSYTLRSNMLMKNQLSAQAPIRIARNTTLEIVNITK